MRKLSLILGIVGTAIMSSLCCITPVLAFMAGTTGFASTFSWLEPARPYFVAITIITLAFAWYRQFKKTAKEVDCNCNEVRKPRFIHSKTFLFIITIFVGSMLAFPLYARLFYPPIEGQTEVTEQTNTRTVEFTISGMTCAGCAAHINHEINGLSGIIKSTVSYEHGTAVVIFDQTAINTAEIEKAINSTGYVVKEKKE